MHWRTSGDPGNSSRPQGYADGSPQGEPAGIAAARRRNGGGDPWRTDGRLAIVVWRGS